jgi:adenosylmethionine-8-amino-7-oxononanoate aminotransferase
LNANLGFGREDIAAQAFRQMITLPSIDATSGHNPQAIELARKLARCAGHNLTQTLFCNSGSEATEAAIKVAKAIAKSRGRPQAQRLVCFEGAYHGCTAGALALTGFEFPRIELDCVGDALAARWPFPERPEDLDTLAQTLAGSGGQDIAGFILEPVQGIGGIRGFSGLVLARLRALADQHDLVLIFDETFSGLGRTGRYFAFQHHGVAPDILLCSKGLTAGLSALSAMTMTRHLYQQTLTGDVFGSFRHGHTMSGNATACAIANTVIDRLDTENLIQRAHDSGEKIVKGLAEYTKPGECIIRGYGLMIGVDVADQSRAEAIVEKCAGHDVELRAQNGVCQITPPLTIGPAAIARIIEVTGQAILDTKLAKARAKAPAEMNQR